MARTGKIARCPEPVREELNQRLRAGQLGPQLLPWINAHPDVRTVLQEFFTGSPINAQNLSDWRSGGFVDWEEKQSRTHRIKELASFALKLTQANGGQIAEGAAAIASGKILELLEAADGAIEPEQIGEVVQSLAALRAGDMAQQRASIDRQKLQQKDQELALARQRFQRDTCELFIKWFTDQRAVQAVTSTSDNSDRINRLGAIMFGEDWKPAA
jgi:hypothetical protein